MESRHLLLHLNLFEDAVKTTSKQKSITLQPIVQISFPSAVYLGNSLGIVWMIKRPTELWARGGELFFTVHTPLGSSFGCQCLNFLQVFWYSMKSHHCMVHLPPPFLRCPSSFLSPLAIFLSVLLMLPVLCAILLCSTFVKYCLQYISQCLWVQVHFFSDL